MDISQMTTRDLGVLAGHHLILDVTGKIKKTTDWVHQNKGQINRFVEENGALLIRGLKVNGSKQFSRLLTDIFESDLLEYTYRSTPRTEFRDNVYTTTEYASNMVIPQHNENAYSRHWPMRLGLLCLIPSSSGGATPLSSSAYIYENLPDEIKQPFEEKGVLYVRNYSDLDLPWTEVFQTEDKAVVEAYCRENEIEFEWLESGLRTRQVNPATAVHPQTGEKLWFNQAHLFHVSSLSEEMSQTLLSSVGIDNLPRHAFYGDGSRIEESALTFIRDLYEKSKFRFDWQKGDLLLVDNMRFTHGREVYEGERKIIIGMGIANQG